jgi:diguanylate cyclase (GGDEF)-like protein
VGSNTDFRCPSRALWSVQEAAFEKYLMKSRYCLNTRRGERVNSQTHEDRHWGSVRAQKAAELVDCLARRLNGFGCQEPVAARLAVYRALSPEEQLRRLPAMYLSLEHWLAADEAGARLLRGEVRMQFGPLLGLEGFGLIFEPPGRQAALLSRAFLAAVLRRAQSEPRPPGGEPLEPLARWLDAAPSKAQAPLPLGLLGDLPTSDSGWVTLFGQMSRALYRRLRESLGQSTAARIYVEAQAELSELYGTLAAFAAVVSLLPAELLDEATVEPLSRAQLGRVLLSKIDLLVQREERLEQQGRELERAQAELQSLRDHLEVRVHERTGALAAANEQLVSELAMRKSAEQQLVHDAFHDALTGLPNRALFMDRLGHVLGLRKRRKNYLFAVLFLDVDRFNIINDSLGHTAGDQMLVELAQRLVLSLRPGDTVARLGGDEFCILLEGLDSPSDATQVAGRILERLAAPFTLGGQEVYASASIGIVLGATGDESPGDILRDADTAMYRAKLRGKSRYEIFDAAMHAHTVARLRLETDLRRALERHELRVHYQPIVSLRTGCIAGAEALVRWQHPERGIIPPLDFIPMAEETGLIVPVGEWVLRTACRQAREWRDAGLPPLSVSVNLSAGQFHQPKLPELIGSVLAEVGLEPSALELEITESVAMRDTNFSTRMLDELSSMGISISIDDFGTGYSSLAYLKRFPIHSMKIDRSFVQDLARDSDDAAITTAIITMAHSLNLKVVAEGVETSEQLSFLLSKRCNSMQGYYFSRPIPADQLARLLAEGRRLGLEPVG